MADWKAQRSYNYNQSNHAYTYSLVYQAGTEQGHGNVSPWDETGLVDLSNYPSGVNQAYYTPVATQRSPEEQSPPHSPEPQAYSGHGHYQGIGLAFLADSQANLLQTGQPPENESRRAGSDSASDSEPHTSPGTASSNTSAHFRLHLGRLFTLDISWLRRYLHFCQGVQKAVHFLPNFEMNTEP